MYIMRFHTLFNHYKKLYMIVSEHSLIKGLIDIIALREIIIQLSMH